MDSADSDMMEANSSSAPAPALPPDQDEFVRNLLTMARQLIDQNMPSQALQAVVMAMRARDGEGAVHQLLHRARELYSNRVQASAAADELASLLAECAIAEATPPNSEPYEHNTADESAELEKSGTSILSETGRKQVMLDAFSDGSSFICIQCGGLVSANRRDEHYSFWCGKM
nr:uncharacterized protein LOC109170213 [Ipomoea trifida]